MARPALPSPASASATVPADDPAHAAGLRRVSDAEPGVRRVRCGRGFRYLASDGRAVRDPRTLERIRSLAIPPTWTDVWICPAADGHVQASGRDARGRKQHRYHPAWSAARNEAKLGRRLDFGLALPRIRERVRRDLRRSGLPRRKVLATLVRLLERSLVRIGCEEYARNNAAHGLATLCDEHVRISGAVLRFRFRGKGGKRHSVVVNDRCAARIVKRCMELPGRELFQYLEGGQQRRVSAGDVNAYLREASGGDFTAKDFRTFGATLLAAVELWRADPGGSATARRRRVVQALRQVSERLGNTPSVCRKYYVNPSVIEAYEDGGLRRRLRLASVVRENGSGAVALEAAERALLDFLRRARAAPRAAA